MLPFERVSLQGLREQFAKVDQRALKLIAKELKHIDNADRTKAEKNIIQHLENSSVKGYIRAEEC